MGLHFLDVFRIGFLDRTARIGVAQKPASLAGAYVIGLAFGFGWSPCVGPVLTAILLMAGASDSAGEGARLLLIYSLGIGVPFLVAAGFAGGFMQWSARFRAKLGLVEKAMGVFLIAAGVLIFTGQMPTIAFWLLETFLALALLVSAVCWRRGARSANIAGGSSQSEAFRPMTTSALKRACMRFFAAAGILTSQMLLSAALPATADEAKVLNVYN